MPTNKNIASRKLRPVAEGGGVLDFTALVDAIHWIHEQSAAAANRTVNATLTLRNWLIGNYIVEYEMRGADRAKYGERLIPVLAEELGRRKISRCDGRELFRYQRFYRTYPQIAETLSPQFIDKLKRRPSIIRSLTGESNVVTGQPIMETLSP